MPFKIPSRKKVFKTLGNYFIVTIGCSISAFSTIGILIPSGLSSGGLTGIVRMLQNVIPFEFSSMYYAGVATIFLACLIFLEFKEARHIIFVSAIYPTLLLVFEKFDFTLLEQDDIFLAAIYCGIISGIGVGLVLQRGFSFGGMDTVAKIIRLKLFPSIDLSQILLILNSIVIISSGFVFGRNIALYALITTAIHSKTINVVMFGLDSKMVQMEIITSENKEITEYILHFIGRGVSSVAITGAYTGVQKERIETICTPQESVLIKTYISSIDKAAFISIVQLESVWGRGSGFGSLS